MNAVVLSYINSCERWKVEIKENHWAADSLSQHELCDDIASEISDFEDLVSEVEQSISGKIKRGELNPPKARKIGLKSFVNDVISESQNFLKELEKMGDKYIGVKSECETFIGVMQRKLYLVNFTLKEELKMRLSARLNESKPKNLANAENIDKFIGRKPKSVKARINQIYRIVSKYGIDSRKYHDESWQAIDDYYKAITSLGCEVELKPCADVRHADSLESDGGYCDYDPHDHMPRSKQYAIKITFDDGMVISGYIKCMAAGTVSDPFSSYDTCIVLWPRQGNVLESKNMNRQIRLTEAELKQVIKEAATKILSETPLNYDVDNFSGRWNKNVPDEEFNSEDYLDNPYDAPNSWDDDEWVDGDRDMENEHSWNAFDRQAVAPGIDDHYNVMKTGVPSEVDKAISRRNRENDWSERELRNRDRMMNKYVNGERDADDIGDAWDDIHYESKKPMKVTEAELKQVIKEAAIKVLSEKIEIDKENKGKFTATQKRTGKSTEELTHSKNPLTRKRANFARMAKRHWKPLEKNKS